MALIAVVNGPNLNVLGEREPEIYGTAGWGEIKRGLEVEAGKAGVELEFFQSNHEGEIIDYLQGLKGRAAGLIINPAALSHYGYALRDAISSLGIVAVEVHITNVFAREEWRSFSVVAPVVRGTLSGFGAHGYRLALSAVTHMLGR